MNEARHAEMKKATVTYHSNSKAYEIHVPETALGPARTVYSQKVDQGFICDGNFVSVLVETQRSCLSPLGIAVIAIFAGLMSVVISAPSVIGLKLMDGIKMLIEWA
jgi:hypothetical protein